MEIESHRFNAKGPSEILSELCEEDRLIVEGIMSSIRYFREIIEEEFSDFLDVIVESKELARIYSSVTQDIIQNPKRPPKEQPISEESLTIIRNNIHIAINPPENKPQKKYYPPLKLVE
jgi:hypothetical protein